MTFVFSHHKIKSMICEKAQAEKCDSICKNEFLLDTIIRYSYETKLMQNQENCKLSHIASENLFH